MLAAPAADLIRKGLGKPFRQMIVIMVPGHGGLIVRQLPEDFRKRRQQRCSVRGLVGVLQIIRPGDHRIRRAVRKLQGMLDGKLGFIGKYGGNRAAEILLEPIPIFPFTFLNNFKLY